MTQSAGVNAVSQQFSSLSNMTRARKGGGMEFSEQNTGSRILEKLRIQRADEKYCDIVLNVEGRVFKAHRNVLAACSPYFDTMCNSGLEEDKVDTAVATIECTSAEAMDEILNYMYTGKICINANNVESILRGADPFLMTALKEYCYQFMWQNMDASNVLAVRHLSDLYGFRDLYMRSEQFIRNKFMQVIQDSMEDILRLTYEDILELITDEKIRVEKEECIYDIVVKWVKFDTTFRKPLFPRLLSHVRLPLINRDYLLSVVGKEELVSEFEECCSMLAEAKHQTDTTRRSYCSDSPVLKPRKGRLTDVVVIIGGVSERGPVAECFAYLIDENKWSSLPALPNELRFHAATILNNCMYVAGGTSNQLTTNRVHCYDPINNSWNEAACLLTPREYLSLVPCDGRLYALGGLRWDRVQQSVERYDPDANKWCCVSQMPTKRYNMQVVTVGNRYIYAIAGRDSSRRPTPVVERYDTKTDEWMSVAPIPTKDGRCWEFPVVEVYQGKIYVTDLSTKLYQLSVDRNAWIEVNCKFERIPERTCFQYCAMNRNVFIFGGWGSERSSKSPISDACIFNQELGLWSNIAPPPASTLASACCFLQVPYEFLSESGT
ncbi:kelch-like protein 12 [Diadema antillarum]|uniref:kelch-like protein 12 n=1 Tax=Diadema antillarum TaxID=105358 RepID=UPI003A88287A